MRNHNFRFSSMIPSEWFYKLKNMTKLPLYSSLTTTKKKKPSSSESKSLPHSYFSNRSSRTSLESKILQISPRNSLHIIQQSKRKSLYKPSPSVSAGSNKKKIKSQDSSSSATLDHQLGSSSKLKLTSTADDIIIEVNKKSFKKKKYKEIQLFDSMEKACRASNRTKHLSVKVNNKEKEEEACRIQKKQQKTLVSSGRRSSSNSPRIKLRVTSSRIQVSPHRSKSRSQRKQVLESFAVIKISSVDPKKDFRESMVEMIEENNIRASQDLEDLLTCYLSLNPKEYHDLIIKVFVQIWLQVINM